MAIKRKNQNNLKKIIVFLILILIVLILALYTLTSIEEKEKNKDNENTVINVVLNYEEVEKSEQEEELKKLKKMSERNRIEYYVSKFIKSAENGNVDEIYSILNKEFRQNYFSTKKEFKDYIKKRFPKMVDISYTNFERNGQIYVIWLILTDAINGNKNSGIEMNFIVKEKDFNDYELSFSVN